MRNESSVRTQVAISLLPRLNNHLFLPLIERCGGIEGFFLESEQALESIYKEFNIPIDLFHRKSALQDADDELEKIDQYGIQICSIEKHVYPELLRQCEDSPLVFFYKGNLKAAKKTKYLAIVGTRHSSTRGQAQVERLLSELHGMGHQPIVVSGLAYGIDAIAHRASLKLGLKTYAVLGHGLHMVYPASHRMLAQSILEADGALISEFPCTAPIHPSNFLKRNRIIAGLSHATLVAESARKGGAIATAHLALSYNREVMAFPGRPDDKYSSGCNQLIKENTAALVENATDVARALNFPVKKSPPQTTLNLFENSDRSTTLLALLEEKGETQIDELCQLSGRSLGELSALLLQLELEGKIAALPGRRYAPKK